MSRARAGTKSLIQDLRATNEELQSTNEEYRSTAEELETSKEELQSINEELHTVNAELKSKLASISVAHSDLQNLTAATEIGTLFLDARSADQDVHARRSPTSSTSPRPISAASSPTSPIGSTTTASRPMRAGSCTTWRRSSARCAASRRRWFVMRVRPYRTVEDRIDGAVVTFVDITARLQAEAGAEPLGAGICARSCSASSQVLYRMSPDWDEMRELVGGGFLSDTNRPDESWLEHYIHPEDHGQGARGDPGRHRRQRRLRSRASRAPHRRRVGLDAFARHSHARRPTATSSNGSARPPT